MSEIDRRPVERPASFHLRNGNNAHFAWFLIVMSKSNRSVIYRLALVGLATASTTACMHSAADSPIIAKAELSNAQGQPSGTVVIRNGRGGPVMLVDATGLAAGVYGMHFHQTGKCETPGFTTAGGHWNPESRKHGLSSANGAHAGDLPNLEINSNDKATVTVSLDSSLLDGAKSLFDSDGAAIIIHARPDDNMTDPSGNSGDRILCGVLQSQSK